ncbi:hypothetical protein B0H11DRAFT_1907771 [Mycena galericulata]|nr:hypothetical protein B0H11DRAFT_1907771 [Mycena galericulata]
MVSDVETERESGHTATTKDEDGDGSAPEDMDGEIPEAEVKGEGSSPATMKIVMNLLLRKYRIDANAPPSIRRWNSRHRLSTLRLKSGKFGGQPGSHVSVRPSQCVKMQPADGAAGDGGEWECWLHDAGVVKEKDGWFKDVYCVCTLQSDNYRLKTRRPALTYACTDSCNSKLAPRATRRLSRGVFRHTIPDPMTDFIVLMTLIPGVYGMVSVAHAEEFCL